MVKTLVEEILHRNENLIIIDGMSCSGKTTLAVKLAAVLDCDIIHIDDFFLPKSRQIAETAGNIDAERFKRQVTERLGNELFYQKYDCKTGTYADTVRVRQGRVIIEGAYSCHKSLGLEGGLRIFLEIDKQEQRRRVIEREAYPQGYFDIWIPRETEYFEKCDVKQNCNIKISGNIITNMVL